MLPQYQILDLVKMISNECVPKAISVFMEEEGEVTKEYEQRWKLKKLPEGLGDKSEIKQAFLFEKPGFNLRIRRETVDGKSYFTLTCKFYKKSDEAEVEITEEMFERLWPETIPENRMEKTRYHHDDWVVDDIRSPEDKKGIVAEIETSEKGASVEPPADWEVEKKFTYK